MKNIICQIHKLNKFIKSETRQILSYKSLERVQVNITYISNKVNLKDLHNKCTKFYWSF